MRKHITAARSTIAGILLLTTIDGFWPTALAQPRIWTQPSNVAVLPGADGQSVLPGQNAQFKMTATGVAPLTYQWRFNGAPLAAATNNSFTVTNVSWTDFGHYDVVVSNSTGAVTGTPAWLMLATRWREIVYFGASEGRVHCGGDPWPVQLAKRLGLPLLNYSQDGANSAAQRLQITNYLKSHTPTTNTLIVTMGAGALNDMIGETPLEQAAANGLSNLRLLAEAGARNFLVPKVGPLELVPAFENLSWLTNELGLQLDALLDEGLEGLKAEYPLTIYRTDHFALCLDIWQNPMAYGFHAPLLYPYSEVFCDGAHFTLAMQIILSQEAYRSMTPPLRIDSAVRTAEGDLALTWSGGSPPIQIQRATNLRSDQWQPVGPPEFLCETTMKCESSQGYFRVIFLGQ